MKLAHRLSAAVAAVSLAVLAACAPTPSKEGTGEYIDDSAITTKVKAALASDPQVKASEVNVETFKGTVQLSGFVGSTAEAQRAVQLAREVQGVKDVKNDTQVKAEAPATK